MTAFLFPPVVIPPHRFTVEKIIISTAIMKDNQYLLISICVY